MFSSSWCNPLKVFNFQQKIKPQKHLVKKTSTVLTFNCSVSSGGLPKAPQPKAEKMQTSQWASSAPAIKALICQGVAPGVTGRRPWPRLLGEMCFLVFFFRGIFFVRYPPHLHLHKFIAIKDNTEKGCFFNII